MKTKLTETKPTRCGLYLYQSDFDEAFQIVEIYKPTTELYAGFLAIYMPLDAVDGGFWSTEPIEIEL